MNEITVGFQLHGDVDVDSFAGRVAAACAQSGAFHEGDVLIVQNTGTRFRVAACKNAARAFMQILARMPPVEIAKEERP